MNQAAHFLESFDLPANGPSTVMNPAAALSANSSFLDEEQTVDPVGGETQEVRTLYATVLDKTWRRYAFDRSTAELWPGDLAACVQTLGKEIVQRRLKPAEVQAAERALLATRRAFGEHFILVHVLLKIMREPALNEMSQRYLHRAASMLAFTVRRGQLPYAHTLLTAVREDRLTIQQLATKTVLLKALNWRMRGSTVLTH
jgi:hypothetical protein